MNTQIVEIQPRELKFIFEVKKQSSCIVHLGNVTDQYVAFKVKTTSPKKYCVRPNVGIIKPKATCDFTVTMQAQKSASSEVQCKDKFLIQSTVVPFGATEEEITPSMFSKQSQKYIEETKLRVVLTTAPNSPAKPLADVVLKQEVPDENSKTKEPHSPVLLNGVIEQEPSYETSKSKDKLQNIGVENFPQPNPKDKLQNGVEYFPQPDTPIKKVVAIENVTNMEESRSVKVMENTKSFPAKDEEFYPGKDDELNQVKDVKMAKLKPTEDIEELISKIGDMNTKLVEAEYTIEKLKEEKTNTIHEKEKLKQELAILKTKRGARRIQVGFPPLFVCMVALISLMMGYLFRA